MNEVRVLNKRLKDLDKKWIALRKEIHSVQEKRDKITVEAFLKKWKGKIFFSNRFSSANLPEDKIFGKVLGVDKEEPHLIEVLEITMMVEYGWVGVDRRNWNQEDFKTRGAKILSEKEREAAFELITDTLNINLHEMELHAESL